MLDLGAYALPTLRAWQKRELLGNWSKPKHAIHADPRLGKTVVACAWLRGLANIGVERMLVTAPLSTCTDPWENTLKAAGLPVLPYYDLPSKKVRALLRPGRSRKPEWKGVLLLNIDALWGLRDLLYDNIEAYVCDEAHETASPSSHRGLAARRIAKGARYVRTLTATPTPNHRGNLWSPLYMVGAYTESHGAFMERYTVRDFYIPSIIRDYVNVQELDGLLKTHASVIRREDVFGPDEYTFTNRNVCLPQPLQQAYRKLAKEWVLDATEGDPVSMLADHTLTRMLRLQQFTSGFLPASDGTDRLVSIHECKIDAALADLSEIVEAGQKAVVFHRWVEEGRVLADKLKKRRIPIYVINGSLDGREREQQRSAFQAHADAAVIVVQIQSGGQGISLSSAHHALYLSRTFSFVHDKQSRDRIFLEHQPRQITYYNIPGTIDMTVAHALHSKQDLHELLRNVGARNAVFGEHAA
jgi:hypothetical protein